MPELWARVVDDKDVTEVRLALLHVLGAWWVTDDPSREASRSQALRWLRARDLGALPYGMDQAVIMARCQLDDLTITPALAALSYDPWGSCVRTAHNAAAVLLATRGLAAVLESLGASTVKALVTTASPSSVRYFGLELLAERPHDPSTLIAALHDEDVVVAQRAAYHLVELSDEPALLPVFDAHLEELRASASVPAPLTGPAAAAAWALLSASRRLAPHGLPAADDPECTEAMRAIHDRLDRLDPILLPHPAVSPDVRVAILESYLPGERTTDPRLLLEGLRLGDRDDDTEPDNPDRVRQALIDAGLRVGEPTSIGQVHGQGGGSYDVLEAGEVEIYACTFGPFVRSSKPLPEGATAAVEHAGFHWIDDTLAARVFEGLSVYYFGRREPLTVGELLFYWQD
ncbi:MAG: hypothetical protein AAF602_28815 [Myxococcota bacterium]